MGARCFYPLLVPFRALIAILTLYTFVAVSIGKKISQDQATAVASSSSPQPNPTSLATEDYFQDSAHLGINMTLLIIAFYVIYSPNSDHRWLSSSVRRMLVIFTFIGLGLGYGISILLKMVVNQKGCNDPYFQNTRSRCWIQYGVSGSEIAWAVLLLFEGIVTVKQRQDKKWWEEVAEAEVQTAVLYQPDLSLAENGAAGGGEVAAIELTETNSPGHGTEDGESEWSPLPQYTRRRPRDQPRIIDSTNPPERLAGAVARRLNSYPVGHGTEGSEDPLSEELAGEPSTAAAVAGLSISVPEAAHSQTTGVVSSMLSRSYSQRNSSSITPPSSQTHSSNAVPSAPALPSYSQATGALALPSAPPLPQETEEATPVEGVPTAVNHPLPPPYLE